jgi:ElaB/YqjD/DUF883 family membrane-anchored ribosome-binding protein
MDHATVKDAVAKAGEAAANSAEQVQSELQDKVAQGKAVWRDAKASAGDAIDKATALARDASAASSKAAAQAGEVAQDVARQVGNQVSQATTALYQQGSAAGNYLTRYTAEQPWTALLAAAAIGYGLAYLVHRPRM